MQVVFINYRTGDGDEAAAMLERGLSDRFGGERVFRATTSIRPGQSYPERLLNAVRNSAVLLAVMGPGWAQDVRLREDGDWVRREILEAYASKVTVIPVLKGRKTERLKAADLPIELARLADVQSLRLEPRDGEDDIRRIGDFLSELVPELRRADSQASPAPENVNVNNTASDIHGTAVQGRDIGGDVGTVIKGNAGSVHAGKGDINQNTQHFSGDGATYVQGDNHGGVGHRFSREREEKNR
ncbi:toll/interleukin-1 receptor domain-containing protein [Actinomadura spongiicola]|uniref:Toll/interleukin-1 receptor domain-containing protein n=1 Tax=Actinomadura spongiicola TaxID=2303421 RepID=A0A372GQD4_9ACTN|nr:toll/interleukin-1 receptor domain-containing protein [Actinomadura spongiicola]RFS87372.1 toll/interleukin-1 receptor domain-containing protein [Actinomadura spongiicola]